jgi:hypothetical protein
MTSGRRAACVAVALLLASASPLATTVARADPTAEDLASARELFKEGRALRDRGDKADLPRALEKLRAAHALGQTPITGLELARTYVLVGRLVDAHEVSLGVARLPVAGDETSRSDVARAEAAKLAAALEPRLAKLVVSVKGLPPASVAVVTVDGEPIPSVAMGEPRRADPGAHEVVLTLPDGVQVRSRVEMKEGESRDVVLEAPPPASPGPAPVVTPEPNELPPSPPKRHSNVLIVTGATTAGFGLLFGASFGIATLNAKGSLAADCPQGRCGPPHYGELSTAQTDATASTVSFIVAGVGVAAVVIDLILRAKGEPSDPHVTLAPEGHVQIEPSVGLGWVGAHGTF